MTDERDVQQTQEIVWAKVASDVLEDAREFARDFVSTSTRMIACYEVLRVFAVERDLALTTAFILVAAPLFTDKTDWWKRTRQYRLVRHVILPGAKRKLLRRR